MDKSSKIYVAGHRGMVGSATKRRLELDGYTSIVGRTHAELELTDVTRVNKFFASVKYIARFHVVCKNFNDFYLPRHDNVVPSVQLQLLYW